MYHLRNVTKRYTRGKDTVHALDGVDLTIGDGDGLGTAPTWPRSAKPG
ncbi:hypothetical protein GCM10010339_34820 [Streptomyces alanosinicus]|uniref:Uncharacterized protein n=1 Tax=Streptomyces alanosinicus TaxID=68171 RepID=A0A918YHJ2_9ACTN|nr:hypothetical protein GCM10010339_34820 [Streptomyces alanosinicus]